MRCFRIAVALAVMTCVLSAQGPKGTSPATKVLLRPAANPVIAFVNMETLVDKHPSTKARQDQIRAQLTSRLESLQATRDSMITMRQELDLWVEGSEEYLSIISKIRMTEASLEFERQIIQAEFQVAITNAMREIYERCRSAVAEVAKDEGISVVAMFSDKPLQGMTQAELAGDILTRPFVYHNPELDITAKVMAKIQ